jgi:C-3',4' desaturase CrtD
MSQRVIVIGAGIGGLTTGALLAKRGYEVHIYDQAIVPGGCASTFKRPVKHPVKVEDKQSESFIFDVGATQVAGIETGGIHHRIFTELGVEIPTATPCDPSCAVFLPNETEPINIWRDPQKWQAERQRQFPNSEPFWQFLQELFRPSWSFQARNPILPPRNLWDLGQLLQALRWDTFTTFPYTFSTVGDALRGFGLAGDRRLRTFLDLQLKLYSQVNAQETALLYAATSMAVSQAPLGLWHLKDSMQVLSDRLVMALEKYGGKLFMRHTVQAIDPKSLQVKIYNQRTQAVNWQPADRIVANVTVQSLMRLLGNQAPQGYKNRVENLKPASGAFVVYLGVDRKAIPTDCAPHLQFLENYDAERSLFVSVSQDGDGRAPLGKATIIASEFTDIFNWEGSDYEHLKQKYTERAIAQLSKYFNLKNTIIHQEAATPKTFIRYTGRDRGMVGGVGMRVSTFSPFGFANRTPYKNLWLVGDCTHPGEGTAGVSYSAISVVHQVCATKS